MRMLLPIVLAMLLVVVAPGSAAACSCAVPGLEESVREAEVVFAGRAITVGQEGRLRNLLAGGSGLITVRFEVSRAWKGVDMQEVVLRQSVHTTCGYGFDQGSEYLVYARREGISGAFLSTSICDRTRPLAEAATDVRFLGPGTVDLSEGKVEGPGIVRPLLGGSALLAAGLLGVWAVGRTRRIGSGRHTAP